MPEGRMLKKAVSTSKRLALLKTDSARMLYTWMLPHLDIEGRYSGNPDVVRGAIVPRLKHFGPKRVESCLQDMADCDLLLLFSVDGDKYVQFRKFEEYQKLRPDREGESRIPKPPNQEDSGVNREDSGLSKVKESKVKESKEKGKWFENIWKIYPNKDGKKAALTHFNASVKTDQDWQDINKALNNYLNCEKVHKGYIKNGSTWFNNWRDWIDYKESGKPSIIDDKIAKDKAKMEQWKEEAKADPVKPEQIKELKKLIPKIGKPIPDK